MIHNSKKAHQRCRGGIRYLSNRLDSMSLLRDIVSCMDEMTQLVSILESKNDCFKRLSDRFANDQCSEARIQNAILHEIPENIKPLEQGLRELQALLDVVRLSHHSTFHR